MVDVEIDRETATGEDAVKNILAIMPVLFESFVRSHPGETPVMVHDWSGDVLTVSIKTEPEFFGPYYEQILAMRAEKAA